MTIKAFMTASSAVVVERRHRALPCVKEREQAWRPWVGSVVSQMHVLRDPRLSQQLSADVRMSSSPLFR